MKDSKYEFMNNKIDNIFIKCDSEIRQNQHMLQCRRCLQWQHRTCQSGVNVEICRSALKTK